MFHLSTTPPDRNVMLVPSAENETCEPKGTLVDGSNERVLSFLHIHNMTSLRDETDTTHLLSGENRTQ